MFNVQSSAAFIDLMLSTFGPFAQAKETVGELFSSIRLNSADVYRAGALKIAQKAAGVGCRFAVINTDEDPAGGPVKCYEKVTMRGFISHLR